MVVWCQDWPPVAAGVDLAVPAVVLHANRVVASTPAARAEGIRVGHRRREAQGRCPHVELVAHDPVRDARAFEAVAGAVEAVTPRVELTRPGVCSFPTRGPSRYFGGDEALARRVGALVDDAVAGPSRVGVADGPFAAALAAQEGRVVPPGATPAFLAPFPVGVLEDEELTSVLVRLGIATLADLAALPRPDLVARFGWPGERAHRLACGDDARLPDTRPPPPDLVASVDLDPPAERVDAAAFAAKRLADDLHERLAGRGLSCAQVLVTAETEHGERHERCWRHEGALTAPAMAERVRWQLEGWLNSSAASRPTSGITHLALAPVEVAAAKGRQLGFWGGETAAAERAARALARVDGLLGPGAATVPERRGGRGPGEVVVLVPADAVDLTERTLAGEGVDAPWPGQLPTPAPARVLPDPVRAEVVDRHDRPVGVSGRGLATAAPARVRLGDGASRAVAGWAGPWPVDERWWDAGHHRRRARFQVLTDDGVGLLLSVEDGRWWLEATYD
ncbi:MAG TPA: DNA polymerase Y family protein [Acidimicrobiales bacterium]|nr:DNA polymerase Y family protein [Acidimicrobiales bacterium]